MSGWPLSPLAIHQSMSCRSEFGRLSYVNVVVEPLEDGAASAHAEIWYANALLSRELFCYSSPFSYEPSVLELVGALCPPVPNIRLREGCHQLLQYW